MKNLRKLLQAEHSELGRLVKFNLYGLKAALEQALTKHPKDPEQQLCQEVLKELNNLLQPESTLEDIVEIPTLTTDLSTDTIPDLTDVLDITETQTTGELKLLRLQEEFNLDKELTSYLGKISTLDKTDPELWNEIQRKLLRVPQDLAQDWRNRTLAIANQVGAQEDRSNCIPLPYNDNKNIFPGLITGSIKIQGLCFSTQEPLDPRIPEVDLKNEPKDFQEDINLVAKIISTYIKLIEKEIEPELHHALKSVFAFDVVKLSSNKEQYIEALIERFKRVLKAEKNRDEENRDNESAVLAWIDLDEAIHSLIFVPPADRFSWWGKLQQQVRRILKEKVAKRASSGGHKILIRILSGPYADVFKFSKDDLRMEFGGNPGDILTCLRVYAKINQQEFPGRVLYRPQTRSEVRSNK